ncbi:FxSxx-COOH system tetratricopeptide repeat protein [Streptomyces melanogenes]|uniref:FxSxx-COOH system tetratricopeptide repeat protein n=1 Tax=Streptomyces melanogenes TaxID=67326 RepID=UPI00167C7303|nr:FxSxx-COOH system tetratricopeptide repeat protein [Streptomyces melanogenes]
MPRGPAAWPHQVGVIPSRAQSFQHRAEAQWLRAVVEGGGTAVVGQVLTGMGGVGKTQLAADYARTAWDDASGEQLDVLVWVTAGTRSAVVDGYAQAAYELCGYDSEDPEQAARAFLAWLTPKAGAKPCRWVIVLDDVADPDDLKHLWPPASLYGRTLVTTRRRDAALSGTDRRLVDVGLFTGTEAAAYLSRALADHGRHEPAPELAALADDFGHLPLGLAQAAAYLIDSGETAAAYRALLADRTTTLADAAPDRLPDSQALPLAAAWSLSIEHADTLRPAGLARPMLHLTAFLDPNGIPETVLTSNPALTHLAEHASRTLPSARQARLALRALHRLSLITHNPSDPQHVVRVHQLIQRATRDTLTPEQHHQTARTAADALLDAWPYPERDTTYAQALRANTTALATCAEDALYRPDAHDVLARTGLSLGDSGQATAARDHFQYLTRTITHQLGPDHPDTLTTRHSLASWRGEAGDAAGAAEALAELLADRVRVLGPDHPDTLITRHNLAYWRGAAGDAAGAAKASTELLADRVRVLGPDHPGTFATRHSLAYWRGEAGDAAGAAEALAELLTDQVPILGPDHPDTLDTRHSLAYWRGEAGDVAGAVEALAELLPVQVRVLGPDHPDTLATRHEVAYWRGEAGDAAGAVEDLVELLPDRVRVLGPDHPHTLATRHSLAYWQGEAGDMAGAAEALAELLSDQVRVLGPDHPHTLDTRHNLAYCRGEVGDAAGAVEALAEVLAGEVRVLGPDHPHTLTTRNNLAYWRGKGY